MYSKSNGGGSILMICSRKYATDCHKNWQNYYRGESTSRSLKKIAPLYKRLKYEVIRFVNDKEYIKLSRLHLI